MITDWDVEWGVQYESATGHTHTVVQWVVDEWTARSAVERGLPASGRDHKVVRRAVGPVEVVT